MTVRQTRASVVRRIARWARRLLRGSDGQWWQSAGGLVFNTRGEVALIRQGRRWTFPKGRRDPGEGLTAAARREVKEETGLVGRIEAYIGVVHGARHETHWFLMRLAKDTGDYDDDEVDEVRFVRVPRARRLLSSPNDRRILSDAVRAKKTRRR